MNAKKAKLLRKFAQHNGIPLAFVKRKYRELDPDMRDRAFLSQLFPAVSKVIGDIRQGGHHDQNK